MLEGNNTNVFLEGKNIVVFFMIFLPLILCLAIGAIKRKSNKNNASEALDINNIASSDSMIFLNDIAKAHFDEVNKGPWKWNFICFQYNGFIKPRIIRNAQKSYAQIDLGKENPIVIIGSFPRGKTGVFITDKAIYYKLANINGPGWNKGAIAWGNIKQVNFTPKMTGSYLVINGNGVGRVGAFDQNTSSEKIEAPVINEFLKLCTDAINSKTEK